MYLSIERLNLIHQESPEWGWELLDLKNSYLALQTTPTIFAFDENEIFIIGGRGLEMFLEVFKFDT